MRGYYRPLPSDERISLNLLTSSVTCQTPPWDNKTLANCILISFVLITQLPLLSRSAQSKEKKNAMLCKYTLYQCFGILAKRQFNASHMQISQTSPPSTHVYILGVS
jgi:hypothetical protein